MNTLTELTTGQLANLAAAVRRGALDPPIETALAGKVRNRFLAMIAARVVLPLF